MFSEIEKNYIISLINTYKKKGYTYYLVHTITENNNNYDICLYVSKEEIKAITDTTFDLTNAVCIQIDSSNRNDTNNNSIHSRDRIVNGNLSTIVSVNQAEFIYTNATYTYSESSICVNPDLMLQGTDSISSLYLNIITIVLLVIIFLYIFFINILRVRR